MATIRPPSTRLSSNSPRPLRSFRLPSSRSSTSDRLPAVSSRSAASSARTLSSLDCFCDTSRSTDSNENKSREATNRVYSKATLERQRKKTSLLSQLERKKNLYNEHQRKNVSTWRKRTRNSPFLINLVADTERIDEESRVATKTTEIKRKQKEANLQAVKDLLLQQTLTETVEHDFNAKQRFHEVACSKLKPVPVTTAVTPPKTDDGNKLLKSELINQSKELSTARVYGDAYLASRFKELDSF
ncbi:hypothetical protein P9112_008740 [Eukaryota sp. TZLM1-RC]